MKYICIFILNILVVKLSYGQVTLRIMNYSPEEKAFYKDISKQFNKEYPDIRLEIITLINTEYKKQLPILFKEQNAPDIFTYHSKNNSVLSMTELLSKNWIYPIGELTDLKEEWMSRWKKDDFSNGINMHNEKIYSFPYTNAKIRGTGYMFRNNEVLIEAGFNDEYVPDRWSDFVKTCEVIKEKTGRYPIVIPTKSLGDFKNTWNSISGSIKTDQFFDYKAGRFAIDAPEFKKAVTFIKSLYDKNLVYPGRYDSIKAREIFGHGNSAFIFDGSWLPNVLKLKMKLDISEIYVSKPPYPDKLSHGALAYRNTENKIWISNQCKNLKQAKIFIEWMTRPNGYYAHEYLKRGLGILAYSNYKNYKGNIPKMTKQIIVAANGLKIAYPEPMLKCPDLSQSKALQLVEDHHPDWEWESIFRALFEDEDFAVLASEIVKKKNTIFEKILKEEEIKGLDVSRNCFQFVNSLN